MMTMLMIFTTALVCNAISHR